MFFFFFYHPYIAVIGDIKGSRSFTDRASVQQKLKEVLEDINFIYKADIASKFMITLGDEFQGLLQAGDHAMHIVEEIERRMYPVRIRFGIGVGKITTDINYEMPIGADGPGYYKARAAIEYLKKNEKKSQVGHSEVRFEIDGDYQAHALMLNTILTLLAAIKSAWSERQREVIWDMIEHQGNQVDAAKRLNIKQPTVQRTLSNGNYYAYREALEAIGKVLEEIKADDV